MRNEESVKPQIADNPEEPEEKGLIYRSNFYLRDDKWREKETDDFIKFRRDGYYHIELNSLCATTELIEIPLTNFRAHVDTELLKGGDISTYGILFRYVENSGRFSFYAFSINLGSYALLLYSNNNWRFLRNYRSCEFIRRDSINTLMVEMVRQMMTVGINGHTLVTIADDTLTLGGVGVFVSKAEDPPVDIRFRDFRLYSLER